MSLKYIHVILIGVFFQLGAYGQEIPNATDFEKHYFGYIKTVVEVDEFLPHPGGYILVRREDKYSVIDEFGEIIIPEGKYMLDLKPKATNNEHLHSYALVVRSPETGLYGLFNLLESTEITPCKYNELTPFHRNLELAIGTYHDIQIDKIVKYFIDPGGEEHRYFEGLDFGSANTGYSRYAIISDNSEIGISLKLNKNKKYIYDIWDGNVTAEFDYKTNVRYHGSDLFIRYEYFNRLQKYAILNHLGDTIIPFREFNHNTSPFRSVHNPAKRLPNAKFASLLTGNLSHYFAYALLDQTGEISHMLKRGEGFRSIHTPEQGKILNGKILVSATKQGDSQPELYLWDLFEEKKLVNIHDMFYGNVANMAFKLHDPKATFIYRGRNGNSILFESNIVFEHDKNLFDIFPMARDRSTSGGISPVNAPRTIGRHGYDVSGYGILDEETGQLKVAPIFKTMTVPDDGGYGLAYAEMEYNGTLYKGFIYTEGHSAGAFQILIK